MSPILIKMVDFKNLAWATSFATRASRKFIYLPYRASGRKVIVIPCMHTNLFYSRHDFEPNPCTLQKSALNLPSLLFFFFLFSPPLLSSRYRLYCGNARSFGNIPQLVQPTIVTERSTVTVSAHSQEGKEHDN